MREGEIAMRFGRQIRRALAEDIGKGDVTTQRLLKADQRGCVHIVAKANGVLCGLPVVQYVFHCLDSRIHIECLKRDGERVRPGEAVARIRGHLRPILSGERVALNFLQHLSGIATQTARFVKAVRGTGTKIYDTRKTTPLWRGLEKYAVWTGGGYNHRMSLFDMILIKDNHVDSVGGIAVAIARARAHKKRAVPIAVEARTLKEVREAVAGRSDLILLDNMSIRQVREALTMAEGKAEIEVSGGIYLARAKKIARLGVSRISIGSLTHSAPALDFSLRYIKA
jgi:nicotinate-nucleotide pyrophosphorylase (carboxylating)